MSKRDFVPLLQVEQRTMDGASPREEVTMTSTPVSESQTVANRAYACASRVAHVAPLALLLALLIVCALPGVYRTEYRLQLGDRDGNNMKLEVDTRVLGIHVRRTVLPCVKQARGCCLPIWEARKADRYPRAVCASQ